MPPQVFRQIGGAGTGKTRYILDSLTQARAELGLSTEEIGFATFTRAGRAEISERAADAWGVQPEALNKHGWFRTAHSMCHRACEIEDGELITDDDWISEAMGVQVSVKLDAKGERTYLAGRDGDNAVQHALSAWELSRNMLVPVTEILNLKRRVEQRVPSDNETQRIVEKYEDSKRVAGRIDFTDLIAQFAGIRFSFGGYQNCDPRGGPPEELRVLAIDEAQDSSRLVDLVCRRLASGPKMERVWICGDPYQSIHGFAGGDYRHFLSWDAIEGTMPQSYRCPSEILELGERCLRRMKSGYRNRGIRPAREGGIINQISSAGDAISMLSADSSALILGRCGFSLAEYEEQLRARGLPYIWVDKTQATTSLVAYRCLWDLGHGEAVLGEEFTQAVKIIPQSLEGVEMLRRGEKAAWTSGKRRHIDWVLPEDDHMSSVGLSPALISMIRGGEWDKCIEAKSRRKASAWLRVASRHGPEIASNPSIRLSTIHSAKGLEADKVILSTISSKATENSRSQIKESYDEECRIAYVAVTRAREEVSVVRDGEFYRMELPV